MDGNYAISIKTFGNKLNLIDKYHKINECISMDFDESVINISHNRSVYILITLVLINAVACSCKYATMTQTIKCQIKSCHNDISNLVAIFYKSSF